MGISKKFVISTVLIAALYFLLVTYLRNFALINESFTFPLTSKLNLYAALIIGMTTSMTHLALILMLITAILIGVNITLVGQRITSLGSIRKIHLATGGSSLLGIVGGGCAACGLPVISLLGLSGSLLFLPFRGAELPYISIFLLLLSLYFLIRSNNKAEVCEVK